MLLKCRDWTKCRHKQRLHKYPNGQVMAIFKAKVTQNPHFLKKCKGGTKRNFSKIAQKVVFVWKAQKHFGAKHIIPKLVCTSSAKTGEDLGANSGYKSARMAKLWQFSQGVPKPSFSEKVERGDQGKFFKNGLKSSLCLKFSKALWRITLSSN